jgi:hypothetical protein
MRIARTKYHFHLHNVYEQYSVYLLVYRDIKFSAVLNY